jgi:hypothetical protein
MRKFFTVSFVLILVTLTCACASSPATPDAQNALFFDDFSKSGRGWTVLQNDSGSISYADGHYRMFVEKPDTLLRANAGQAFQDDVRIEVDARKVGGSDDNYFGVICRYQNPDNYYMFLITSDGYSGIVMRKNGNLQMISPGAKFLKMKGINLGSKTNHIRVDCAGESLTLYANGTQVSSSYDHSFVGGDAGLVARSNKIEGGMDIQFDNFAVYNPTQP